MNARVLKLAWPASLALAFVLGLLCQRLLASEPPQRVTGIGGIFFKAHDPAALKEWYARHLGLAVDRYGCTFEWRTLDQKPARTQWNVTGETDSYFKPSASPFMINYRVANLEALVAALKTEGVPVLDPIEATSYGSFVHILDPEGNKIELWQP